jgi:HEAT repeat protein
MFNWHLNFFGPNYRLLESQGQSENTSIRAAALAKLGELATPQAIETLYNIALRQPKIYGLDKEVAEVISQIDQPKAFPSFAKLIDRFRKDPSHLTVKPTEEAVWKVAKWTEGQSTTFELLAKFVADFREKPESVKQQITKCALGTLATMPGRQAAAFDVLAAVVADYVNDPVHDRRAVAKTALYNFGNLGTPAAIDYLQKVQFKDAQLQCVARATLAECLRKLLKLPEINSFSELADWTAALEQLDPELAARVIPEMVKLVADPGNADEWDLRKVLPLLAALGRHVALPLLVGVLHINRIQSEPLQIWAAYALGDLGDRRAVDALIDACDYEHRSVRFAAINALVKIAGITGKKTLLTPKSWEDYWVDMWTQEASEQLREALAILLPGYRKSDYSSGSALSENSGQLTQNQQVFNSAACAALDRMRTIPLEDTPLHRQVKSTLEHLRRTRDCSDPRMWVITTDDFPPFNDDFLRDLETHIRWDSGSYDQDRKRQILLSLGQDQLLTTLRKLGFIEKVGDKRQLAGFLVHPFARDFQISCQ